MTYYAVIDTNVIVSSMLNNDSIPGRIMQYVSSGIIIPLLNEEILKEYSEVITRNKFGFTQISIDVLLKELKEKGLYIEREQTLEEFIDKDDIVFFEIVMSARTTMDAYLVTGNMKHYPIRSYIVTPREMIEIINKEDQAIKNLNNS
jgi:putative PIN family toxin of toxin-antitoxin system